jgi:glycosyltransferase involved in cell wall biosynthesis
MSLRRRAGRILGPVLRRTGSSPRLSVVVPVYNVQGYLPECLDSILSQSFDDLEVVVVDDGSTDGSRAVAQEYAGRFGNVRVVATENQGLGAARNTGVQHARGELLAFADSDDVVLPEAYAAMVSVLDESGSDFVVGGVARNFGSGPPSMSARQRARHEMRRLAITVDDFPEILGDVFAWNKVFRRGFWDSAGLSFPVGIRYEDQPTLTRAYLTARGFDVIKRPVYLWRIREDSTSITQRRHELDDLRDRFLTKQQSLQTVRELGSPAVLRAFYLDGLAMDMPGYFRNIPGCSDDYWEMLHSETARLWEGAPSFALAKIPAAHRLIAWLVASNRRSAAVTVAGFAEQHRPVEVPVLEQEGEMIAKLPFWDDPASGIPPELYRLQEHERAARRRAATAPAEGRPGRGV